MDMTTFQYRIGYSTSIATTLLLAALLQTANSHALPRPTPTVALREFSVESWPLAPTNAPQAPNDILRRQFNTICGYIGGDPDLPATCSAGSHCAADSQNGVIGCCPDEGPCTQGIFTGCIDRNSDPQTEINPYVFTCSGNDVCYQNKFDEGFFQYGCGSASSLANTVATAVSGIGGLNIASVSVDLTASAISLSEPTTIGTRTRARTTDTSTESSTSATSSSSSSSSSSSESSTSGETTVASETSATVSSTSASSSSTSSSDTAAGGATAPNRDDDGGTNVGAIVGGSVGGVAAVAMLLTMAIWLWKRKSRNARQGPGLNQSTEYITSVVHAQKSQDHGHADVPDHSPMTDNRQQFSQLPTTWEEPEPEVPPHIPKAYGGIGSNTAAGGLAQHYDSNSSGSMRGAAVGGSQPYEPDREPLTGELDDFSRGFNTAIDDIDGNDETQPNGQGMRAYTRSRGEGGRPLWQQNRRRSRNMMWM